MNEQSTKKAEPATTTTNHRHISNVHISVSYAFDHISTIHWHRDKQRQSRRRQQQQRTKSEQNLNKKQQQTEQIVVLLPFITY